MNPSDNDGIPRNQSFLKLTSPVWNYVISCSCVYNLLSKRVSDKCMETHTYIRGFSGKGYLSGFRTISSEMSFRTTVIALHTCYILIFIALIPLLLGNTISRSGLLTGTRTFLSPFATKRPFTLRIASWQQMLHLEGRVTFDARPPFGGASKSP